jgi:hypothetical protein
MQDPEIEKADKKQMTFKKSLAFSIEFGFMIIIPLLIFSFGGKWLSQRYDNIGFFYGGIVLALLTSIIWFYKRINDIYNDFIK